MFFVFFDYVVVSKNEFNVEVNVFVGCYEVGKLFFVLVMNSLLIIWLGFYVGVEFYGNWLCYVCLFSDLYMELLLFLGVSCWDGYDIECFIICYVEGEEVGDRCYCVCYFILVMLLVVGLWFDSGSGLGFVLG